MMLNWKTTLVLGGLFFAASNHAFAQFHTVYSPYVPVVQTPGIMPPQVVVARPVIAPQVITPVYAPPMVTAPVVTAYRPVVPATYVVPAYTTSYAPTYSASYVPTYSAGYAPAYSAYRPVVPVAPVPVYSAPLAYRPGVVGVGVGGVPTVYTPGQPVRNVLRYIAP